METEAQEAGGDLAVVTSWAILIDVFPSPTVEVESTPHVQRVCLECERITTVVVSWKSRISHLIPMTRDSLGLKVKSKHPVPHSAETRRTEPGDPVQSQTTKY